MTADTILFTILYLLLLMESCASRPSSDGIPNMKRRLSLRYAHRDALYTITCVKCHTFRSICGHKDRTAHGLVIFLKDANPTETHERSHDRPARQSTIQNDDLDEILEEKFFILRIPFVSPIENLLNNVNYQIRRFLYPNHNKVREKDYGRKQANQRQSVNAAISRNAALIPQVRSTLPPITRKIRSTVIAEGLLTTPALPPHTQTTNVPTPEIKTQIVTQLPKITVKIPDTLIVTKRLPNNNKETKITKVPNLSEVPEIYKPTTPTTQKISRIPSSGYIEKIPFIQQKFAQALDVFERKYYSTTFGKLSSISPSDRRENGISFVGSGLFLFLILSAMSMEVDLKTKAEIDSCLALQATDADKAKIIKRVLDELPPSSDVLKFRWSTRLVVNSSWHPARATEEALRLQLDKLKGNETPEQLMKTLNHMVEQDSGGAMRNTFEEEELAEGARTVLINTMYLRARWRAAPTLLNGTRAFRDADGAPQRTTRMVRINDNMRFADLAEWDAQAVEIPYAMPGLRLLLLVPRGRSLRALSEQAASTSLNQITARMRPIRVAVTLPIFTLRMTLLLPNKLQAMGVSRLVDPTNDTNAHELRLSHAVQRLMFWAEAGRNAFKDDGIEWDDRPELEMMVDQPYIFYVRWRNLTLLNGNFVL